MVFTHGVASGDPLHHRVILWTRVVPARADQVVHGRWSVARDPRMKRICSNGRFATDISRDFTVKVDAAGLDAGVESVIGRTRTLGSGHVDRVRLAFASCSNYRYGYCNAYARIAERNDLDFALHLGDYLYEYQLGGFADPRLAGLRDVAPTHEILTLIDYRTRHALYKSDPDLQEAHRQHPFICWDDHESANDAWRDGAQNHNPDQGEGDSQVRRRNVVRAYNEYMPIRSARCSASIRKGGWSGTLRRYPLELVQRSDGQSMGDGRSSWDCLRRRGVQHEERLRRPQQRYRSRRRLRLHVRRNPHRCA